MRLFIALQLPNAVIAELAAVQERLRHAAQPVRWVEPQSIHLTLQFLGETPAEHVPALLAALHAIPPTALALQLGHLGAFPNLRASRVLWVGIAGDTTGLKELHAAVVRATAPLGFVAEARPFNPHLTLGRVRPDASPAQRHQIGAALTAADQPAALHWTSTGPVLYASSLTPQGAVYEVLG
jgi:2'-5' RNA ligase